MCADQLSERCFDVLGLDHKGKLSAASCRFA